MKKFLLTIAAVLMGMAGFAQTLTIEDCVGMAREHYPSLAQYGLLDRTTELSLSNVAKNWMPQGNVYLQGAWQNGVAELPEALTNILHQQGMNYPGLHKWQYKAGIEVTQQIWDGGRTSASKRAISAGAEVDRRSLDLQLYDVEGRVQEIYFSILLVDARIKSVDESSVLVDSTLQQVRAMYRNGVAMRSDCDQIEARWLTLQQQKAQLATNRASLQRVLEIFIGESLDGRELVLPNENVTAEGRHPQQRLFDSQLANVSAQEAGVKASVMPTIGAFASGYYGYPGYNMFKNMQNHDPTFNFILGIKASWSFSSLYTRKNSLSKLAEQRSMIESNREVFNFNNRIAMQQSNGEIDAMREVISRDEGIVSLRHSVMRAAQSQLRNGVIDATALLTKITDVELAENDLALHRIQLIQAIYNLNHLQNK